MKYLLLFPLALVFLGHAKDGSGQTHPYVLEGSGTVKLQDFVNESRVDDSNNYIDMVLHERMPRLFNMSPSLYPSIPSFTFTVYKTGLTNRDLKVNVTEGAFKNFDWAIRRMGDCNPVVEEGNTSISCNLEFNGIVADLAALTEGDTIFGSLKTVNVEALLYNTTGRLEITARRYRPAYLRAFYVEDVKFDIKPSDNLYLNEVRMRNFKTFVTNKLKGEFYKNIYGNYKRLLRFACARGSPLFD